MRSNQRQRATLSLAVMLVAALVLLCGCGTRRVAAPLPPPPPTVAAAASLSVHPPLIQPQEAVGLPAKDSRGNLEAPPGVSVTYAQPPVVAVAPTSGAAEEPSPGKSAQPLSNELAAMSTAPVVAKRVVRRAAAPAALRTPVLSPPPEEKKVIVSQSAAAPGSAPATAEDKKLTAAVTADKESDRPPNQLSPPQPIAAPSPAPSQSSSEWSGLSAWARTNSRSPIALIAIAIFAIIFAREKLRRLALASATWLSANLLSKKAPIPAPTPAPLPKLWKSPTSASASGSVPFMMVTPSQQESNEFKRPGPRPSSVRPHPRRRKQAGERVE